LCIIAFWVAKAIVDILEKARLYAVVKALWDPAIWTDQASAVIVIDICTFRVTNGVF
jgi:hypothetical protein